MKHYLQLLKIQHSCKGFTLIELLLAMSITSIVLSIAGAGLVTIMQANQKAERENESRVNLNRAMDFIADEVRMANRVSPVTSGSSFSGTGTTGVLLLTIPPTTVASNNANIVYFLRDSTTTWVSPKTIIRAAPASGSFYSTTSAIAVSSGDNVLVDGITAPTSAPTCPSDIVGGTLVGADGFYACIGSDRRTVQLYLYGKLSGSLAPYQVTTRVFARSQ